MLNLQEASNQSPSLGVHFLLAKTQVGKYKPVARHNFSNLYRKAVLEHRAGIDEGVEFPVLATGVNLWRQVRKQLFIEFPAGKFGRQKFGVNTGQLSPHPGLDHGMCKLPRGHSPHRENWL